MEAAKIEAHAMRVGTDLELIGDRAFFASCPVNDLCGFLDFYRSAKQPGVVGSKVTETLRRTRLRLGDA